MSEHAGEGPVDGVARGQIHVRKGFFAQQTLEGRMQGGAAHRWNRGARCLSEARVGYVRVDSEGGGRLRGSVFAWRAASGSAGGAIIGDG